MKKIIISIFLALILSISVLGSEIVLSPDSEGYKLCIYTGEGIFIKCLESGEGINISKDDYYFKLEYSSAKFNLLKSPTEIFNLFILLIVPLIVIFFVIYIVWGLTKVIFR